MKTTPFDSSTFMLHNLRNSKGTLGFEKCCNFCALNNVNNKNLISYPSSPPGLIDVRFISLYRRLTAVTVLCRCLTLRNAKKLPRTR